MIHWSSGPTTDIVLFSGHQWSLSSTQDFMDGSAGCGTGPLSPLSARKVSMWHRYVVCFFTETKQTTTEGTENELMNTGIDATGSCSLRY